MNSHLKLSRPQLTTNSRLMRDFIALTTPRCALGLLEENGAIGAFFAVCPTQTIRARDARVTFSHGHAIWGWPGREVLQFGFTFFEHFTLNVLVNPANVAVQRALTVMLARRHYFVIAIRPEHRPTVFRADLTRDSFERLTAFGRRAHCSAATETEYQDIVKQFRKKPTPQGEVLEWVCRDDVEYLDLAHNRIDMLFAD